jgi:ketosteroid isomerase-like protein
MSTEPKEVVFQFLRFMSTGDPEDAEKAGAMFTEDAEFWIVGSLPMSGTVRGREEILEKRIRPGSRLTVPGSKRLQIGSAIAEGDYVAVEWKSQREVAGMPDYQNEFFGLFRVEGDKIALLREYMDTQSVKDSRWRENQPNLIQKAGS